MRIPCDARGGQRITISGGWHVPELAETARTYSPPRRPHRQAEQAGRIPRRMTTVSQPTPSSPAQFGYDQQPGLPPADHKPQKTNTMAILGLIFAFVFSPLGIVFSAVGLSQIKKRREDGRGLAIAGLILSIVFLLVSIAVFAFALSVVTTTVEESTSAAAPLDAASADVEGVAAACEVIMPAMMNMETDMATVTTPEDYAAVITDVRTAFEDAAAESSDAAFIADVQRLSDDLQLASDAVVNGEDPAYLESALADGGARVGASCAMAGWTE
jgi:hypothetical protein